MITLTLYDKNQVLKSWSHTQTQYGIGAFFNYLWLPTFSGCFFFKKKPEALRWCRHGAELGSASLQHHLAMHLLVGENCTKNPDDALVWLRHAAEQGYAAAQNNFGSSAGSRPTRKKTIWFLFCYRSTYMLYVICYMLYVICYNMLYVWIGVCISLSLYKYIYIRIYIYIPVVPGQAGGGSFQKEKNYIAQKEFAYRMCAWWPTSAMPKSFLCCERAFCPSMVVMFCAL